MCSVAACASVCIVSKLCLRFTKKKHGYTDRERARPRERQNKRSERVLEKNESVRVNEESVYSQLCVLFIHMCLYI